MDEELNENELEDRLYAMLHHVDESQANVIPDLKNTSCVVANIPRSTVRRYWRTSDHTTPQQRVNTPKETTNTAVNKSINIATDKHKPKDDEKSDKAEEPKLSADLSILQSTAPENFKKTIEFLDHEDRSHVVELESSDDDEVIEVMLPPKPTITIESSDEEPLVASQHSTPAKRGSKPTVEKPLTVNDRESTSPVPSVVSSISDEFIRSDCIALNISSRHPDNHSFDFSLHGSDFLDQSTPSKKKKRKKSKETVTSTPANDQSNTTTAPDNLFATPKSKAKNKKQKNKSNSTPAKNILHPDVYDSDSNQSAIDTNKQIYNVSNKSIPSADVYESDSNQSEPVNSQSTQFVLNDTIVDKSNNSISDKPKEPVTPVESNRNAQSISVNLETNIVDLTDNALLDENGIEENFIVANVTGLMESEDYENIEITPMNKDIPMFGSTKVPAILYEDLDFDNLKSNGKAYKRKRYSLTTLQAEMEKFYNESWGGENFNHRELQKSMSRDKSLWVIDPKDRMQTPRRKTPCNYCNRVGHRDDTCKLKPAVCYMCGSTGHYEPRCPSKICVNCGSPNHMYSSMCRNCSSWNRINCEECGQNGHPSSHCPDLWRRYHNTIDSNLPLEQNCQNKKHYQLFCSGCTRRGHLVHTCRHSLPFSGLPINSPFVTYYRPIYAPTPLSENPNVKVTNIQRNNRQPRLSTQDCTISSGSPPECNKRHSKSPVQETHANKKRHVSLPEATESPEISCKASNNKKPQRKLSQNKDQVENINKVPGEPAKNSAQHHKSTSATLEKALDYIPITSTNHDKRGQMIQDNEVSDTSDIITSARIYITNDIIEKLKTDEGRSWLKESFAKCNVIDENTDITSFLSIRGKVSDQEAFQTVFRDWIKITTNTKSQSENEMDSICDTSNDFGSNNIPRKKSHVLRKIKTALCSLKDDLGDPYAVYKELIYLQKNHQHLINQKVVSPKKMANSKENIKIVLKKLNMMLLGQAGLADGSKHVSQLQSLAEVVTNTRQKFISVELREEIGEHYHCIFAGVQRDDYAELIKKYTGRKQASTPFKKKGRRENPFKVSPRPILTKKFKALPQKNMDKGNEEENKKSYMLAKRAKNTYSKLVSYHKRLINARPSETNLKKTRSELIRRLHMYITMLCNNPQATSKTLRKMKKVSDKAQLFLTRA